LWRCPLAAVAVAVAGGGEIAQNHPPRAVGIAGGAVILQGTQIKATLAGTVHLDASGSTDDDHDPLAFQWTLTGQPSGGTASVSVTGAVFDWIPPAMGTYTFTLR
jgi:hypothetical protein